jgi:hypothetical protein
MQLISQGVSLAAASAFRLHPRIAEFLQRDEIRHLGIYLAALFVYAEVIHILALWGASRIVARNDHCTLGNSIKVWLFSLLLLFPVLFALVVGICVAIPSHDPWAFPLIAVVVVLIELVLTFLILMKLYDTGFLHALGILILTFCLQWGAMKLVDVILVPSKYVEKDIASLVASMGRTPAERQAFADRLLGKQAPDEIDRMLDEASHPIGPQPSLVAREATLRNLQQKLTARQRTLQPADALVYQSQLARYLQLRDEWIAARNATPSTPGH